MNYGDAACRGMDPDLFFPERGAVGDWSQAKAVCFGCQIRIECRETALAQGERHGIWGGLSERERRRERARRVRVSVLFAELREAI